jgi:glycosyltransferase involved in cell wall biosynthesis
MMSRRILYLQYTNPANYPPLEHGGLILLKAGWEVWFFGIQSEGESNKLAFPAPLAERQTLWPRSTPGLKQKLHFIAFTLAALWQVIRRRPAWVYCSDLMSCPAAWLIGALTRCQVLYHEHDSPEDVHYLTSDLRPLTSRFQHFLLWSRRRVGLRADLVVLPNQKRLDLLCQTAGRKKNSLCVFNCPRQEELTGSNGERGGHGIVRLAFHGSINQDRLPLAILTAMSRFPGQVCLSVAGYEPAGSRGYMREFLQRAAELGLGKQVEFVGALPTRRDLYQQASKCNVGLAFMPLQDGDMNMANMTGASNKPFDYLACGLALLVSARPEWEEMFVRPGYGRSCDPADADSIAAQLDWFLKRPADTRRMGTLGRQRILADWNYETQFAPVLNILNQG